jgi:hypothetical protein
MIRTAGEMHSGRFYFRIRIFDRRGSGARKCLFFLQINQSHKVVVCVNKKFAHNELRKLLILDKDAISATSKSLIFVFKLEMLIGSIFICQNEFDLPNPDRPVGARRKSRFIGEPKRINSSRKHEKIKIRKKII